MNECTPATSSVLLPVAETCRTGSAVYPIQTIRKSRDVSAFTRPQSRDQTGSQTHEATEEAFEREPITAIFHIYPSMVFSPLLPRGH